MDSKSPVAASFSETFKSNLKASIPASYSEVLSIFWSGALAGLSLEAAVHGARVLAARRQELYCGRHLGSLGLKWWVEALRSPLRPKSPYQGAVGTLAAGTVWSGIFGSVYVPVRAAVDATAPADQPAWGPALGAAAGSLAASSVRVPKQVVKARMERSEFFCSLQAFELILTREGPRSLYRGWTRSVVKNMPFDALLFLLYDTGKTRLQAARQAAGQAMTTTTTATDAHMGGQPVHGVRHGSGAADGGPLPAGPASDVSRGGAAAGGHVLAEEVPGVAGASSQSAAPRAPLYGFWDAVLVGGIAGAATGLLTSPLEVVRLLRTSVAAVAQISQPAAGPGAASPGTGGGGGGGVGTAPASRPGAAAAASSGSLAVSAAPMPLRRLLLGGVMSRVLWSALEGAVFFPSLEAAIPLCDQLFLDLGEEPQEGGAGGSGWEGHGEVEAGGWGQARGMLRHPAHPLHW